MGEKSPNPRRSGQALFPLPPPSLPHSPIPPPLRHRPSSAPEFGARFFKISAKRLPARIASLDPEFRRLDLSDRGFWSLDWVGEGSFQSLDLGGCGFQIWGGGRDSRA